MDDTTTRQEGLGTRIARTVFGGSIPSSKASFANPMDSREAREAHDAVTRRVTILLAAPEWQKSKRRPRTPF
eukprot:2286083-Amphidinium_carterae.1